MVMNLTFVLQSPKAPAPLRRLQNGCGGNRLILEAKTAAMSRELYAGLCHTFLVSSIGRRHGELGRFTAHDPVRRDSDQSQRTR